MTPTSADRVVVIGGGITGLAAAYRLQLALAGSGVCVTLLEAAPRLGGWICTERWNGVVIEAGPDSFLATKPAAERLVRELGLADQLVGLRPGFEGAWIAFRGRLEPLPEGFSMMVPTRIRPFLATRLLSPRGKLRAALDIVLPARTDERDESIAAFVRRRLGNEVYERIAQPLLAGIYAGDAEHLSLLATFPQFKDIERRHRSLILGTVARTETRRPARSPFLTLRTGMQTLVDTLLGHLRAADVRTGDAVVALTSDGNRYRVTLAGGQQLDATAVVLATPAYEAARLAQPLDSELAQLLAGIPYASSAAVTLVYPSHQVSRVARGRGLVVPASEGRPVTAVTWVTNKLPDRAPPELAVVRVFLGRYGQDAVVEQEDAAFVRLALTELAAVTGLRADPLYARVHRHRCAMPQYLVGHLERVRAIDRRLSHLPGLALAGAAYRGVGIPDCIASAYRAADALLPRLVADASRAP